MSFEWDQRQKYLVELLDEYDDGIASSHVVEIPGIHNFLRAEIKEALESLKKRRMDVTFDIKTGDEGVPI